MAKYDEKGYYEDDAAYEDSQDKFEHTPKKQTKKRTAKQLKKRGTGFVSRHPIISNLVIIIIVAILGLFIAYLSLGLFTNHGESDQVPRVINLSYSEAVAKLHDAGFKVEIKDSVHIDDVRPGAVVDQFPNAGSMVKPGRKIYLYINALHPMEVIIDPGTASNKPALYDNSERQAMAKLQELGFKKIKVEYVPGVDNKVFEVLANGKRVKKMQSVPLNASIILRVHQKSSPVSDNTPYYPGMYSSQDSNSISSDADEAADHDYLNEEAGSSSSEESYNSHLE